MIVYMYYGLLPEIKLSYLILSYNDKIHKNHRETKHMQHLHLICIVSQHCLKPATTPQPLPTTNHYKHISRNPELPFCSNIIHYSVLYNYTVCIVHV